MVSSIPYYTVITGLTFIVVGIILMGKLPQNLMPTADRNQFAVEIYLPTGTAIGKNVSHSRHTGKHTPCR